MPALYECIKHFENNDWERAIDCLTQIIELDSNNALAFYHRGLAKGRLHRYESAISDYDRAIEFDPNGALAFYHRGLAKVYLERFESATSDFDRAFELDPNLAPAFQLDQNNALSLVRHGIAKAAFHHYESAISDYDRAIELDPNDAWTFYSRGNAKVSLRWYESAISDYDRAIELDLAPAFISRGNAKSYLRRYESAISDYDRAIEFDPSDAFAFYNRGLANLNLHRYESAISDFDCAIKINAKMSFPYFGKAIANWKGYNDWGTAQRYFSRFIFLADAEQIVETWKHTHDFYTQHTTAPFLLYRVFYLLPDIGDFHSWQKTLYEIESNCHTLKNYLQHLSHTGEPEWNASQFHRLEALVHYFMGDPLEAYRIYDEILDDELGCLTLMDNYYFFLSAADFLEPSEGIRHFALQQADRLLENTRSEGNEREHYYAGQLHTLGDNWEKAFEVFGQVAAFFPAAVMQAVAAERLDKPQVEVDTLWKKVKQLATAQPPEAGINGFPKFWLELGREDYLTPFLQYAHFREIAEHLHRFREDNAPLQINEFWEIWQLSPADEQEIAWQVRKRELEKIEAELQSFFTQNLAQQYAGYTTEQLAKLELVLAKKKKDVQEIFEKLQLKAASGSEALEHQLGLEIDHWELRSAHTYALMLKYFFLSGKLQDKPALLLYFYNDATAAKKQRDYEAAMEAYVEGAQPVFSLLVNTLLRLGDVASAVAAGALSVLTLQFFNQNQALLDEDDPMSNYQKFKAAFLQFLSIEMESMGRKKFFDKYPLQGWEDWKK
jgi:tetratricopeptide (TPR) repeat protein